jgi:hypothetical protein
MPIQQLGQKFFVDGNLTTAERGQLFLIVVDKDNLVPQIGETGSCDQADVSRTYNRNANRHLSLKEWFYFRPRGALGDVNGANLSFGILRYAANLCIGKVVSILSAVPQ